MLYKIGHWSQEQLVHYCWAVAQWSLPTLEIGNLNPDRLLGAYFLDDFIAHFPAYCIERKEAFELPNI